MGNKSLDKSDLCEVIAFLEEDRNISHPIENQLSRNQSSCLEGFPFRVLDLFGESNSSIDINQLMGTKAVLMGGILDSDLYPELGVMWENKFLRLIDEVSPSFSNIIVSSVVSNSLKLEMLESVQLLKPILAFNLLLMIFFCMAICFTEDITSSKPWMGFAGVVSTLLSCFTSYGGLVYLGAAFTSFNYGAIFVLIGVGKWKAHYIC